MRDSIKFQTPASLRLHRGIFLRIGSPGMSCPSATPELYGFSAAAANPATISNGNVTFKDRYQRNEE